jgi:DNA-binding response OmpR family regulator
MRASRKPAPLSGRVLVVDDDVQILNFIQGALEDEGLTVMSATDGGRAVEIAKHFEPDLLIVDVTLPVLSGHAVASSLRAFRGKAVPVLVITADGHASEKARQLNAFAYLRKPFELDDLVDEVRRGLDTLARDR